MVMRQLILAIIAAVATAGASGADPQTPAVRVELRSAYFSPGLPLAETGHLVYAVHIEAHVHAKGEGKGRLTLVVTPPNYDTSGRRTCVWGRRPGTACSSTFTTRRASRTGR